MSWFTNQHRVILSRAAEGLHKDSFAVSRVQGAAYAALGALPGKLVPPGAGRSEFRNIAPSYLKNLPLGVIEVSVDSELGVSIVAKDRMTCTTKGNRVFEVIAPVTPRTVEIRRKLLVREIHQPERVLYIVKLSSSFNSLSGQAVAPLSVVKVLPIPFIEDDQIDSVTLGEAGGAEIAVLARFKVSEIPYNFINPASPPDYFVIARSGDEVTPEAVRDNLFPRYSLQAAPMLAQIQWSRPDEWTIKLVQDV